MPIRCAWVAGGVADHPFAKAAADAGAVAAAVAGRADGQIEGDAFGTRDNLACWSN